MVWWPNVYIYIYKYIVTSQLRTTAPRDCHCSAQLRPPLRGLPSRATACRYVYTGPGGCLRWPPTPPGPRWPPANNRSFTSIQMVHTHTLSQTEAFTRRRLHRDFYSKKLLHTHTHTRAFLVHTHTFTHIEAFRHRRVHRHFYTQMLLHTNAFTHRRFYNFASRLSQSGTYFLLSTWRSYSFFDVWFRLRLTLLEDLHRFREVLPGDLL